MARKQTVKLGAAAATAAEPVRLTRMFDGEEPLDVNLETGEIKNASVITRGPALGHGFDVDDVMLKQVADGINARSRGIVSRVTHPEGDGWFSSGDDGSLWTVGSWRNARVEGDRVRADFKAYKFADISPKGQLKSWLLGYADEAPQEIGISIVFVQDDPEPKQDENDQSLPPAGRVKELLKVDFVGDPAANRNGLLSKGKEGSSQVASAKEQDQSTELDNEEKEMDKLRAFLKKLGLKNAEQATADDMTAFVETLTSEQKEAYEKLQKEVDSKSGESAAAEAVKLERERTKGIRKLAKEHSLNEDWADGLIERGVTLEHAQSLVETAKAMKPVATVSVNDDLDKSSLAEAISDSILLRAGVQKVYEIDPKTKRVQMDDHGNPVIHKWHDRAGQFRGRTMVETMRAYLAKCGVPGADSMERTEVASLALNRMRLMDQHGASVALAMGSDSFPYILENTARKRMMAGYVEYPKNWNLWASSGTQSDFKTFKVLKLSNFPGLEARGEGEPLKYGTFSEDRESGVLTEYAKGIRYTRQMAVNDDLGAFDRLSASRGGAAARIEDDVTYAALTANATMTDGYALFSTEHDNLQSGSITRAFYIASDKGMIETVVVYFLESEPAPVMKMETDFETDDIKLAVRHTVCAVVSDHRGLYKGGEISKTNITAGITAIEQQTGLGGEYLDLQARYLLIATADKWTAKELINSTVDPAVTKGHAENVLKGALEIVSNRRLD